MRYLIQYLLENSRFLGVDRKPSLSLENVDIDNFLVKVNYDRTVINKKDTPPEGSQDKFAFMAEVEKDANRRATERKQRESVAQELRKLVIFWVCNFDFFQQFYPRHLKILCKNLDL
jgi:hypothetical protein